MPRFFEEAVSRKALVTSALFAFGLAAGQAQAEAVPLLANGDFDLPDTFGAIDTFGAALEIPGWIKLGPETVIPQLPGPQLRDTGIFLNVASAPFPTVANSNVPALGFNDQLAFIDVNPDANQGGAVRASISQETAAFFETGKDYTFTLAVGPSVTSVALPGSTLVLSIGYFAPGDGLFVSVADSIVLANDGDPTEDANELKDRDAVYLDFVNNGDPFDLLKDFSVTAIDPLLSDANAAGNEIAVRVTQEGGIGGRFILDQARLTQVPEPSSLALLSAAGLLGLRRRR